MQDFQTWILRDKTVAKNCEYNFVETERTPTATNAATNAMTQASVTPTTGILFSSILDPIRSWLIAAQIQLVVYAILVEELEATEIW